MKKELKNNLIVSSIYLFLFLVLFINQLGSLKSTDFNKFLIILNLVNIFVFCIYLLNSNRFEFKYSLKEFKYFVKTKTFFINFIFYVICLSTGYFFVFFELDWKIFLFIIVQLIIALNQVFLFIQFCKGKSREKVNLYFWIFVSINLTLIYLELNFSIPEINLYNPISGMFFGFRENFEINFTSSLSLLLLLFTFNFVIFQINKK